MTPATSTVFILYATEAELLVMAEVERRAAPARASQLNLLKCQGLAQHIERNE